MPTILTHAAVPLIAGWGLGTRRVPLRLILAGMVAAMLPDADVLGFRFGIPYDSPFGHRGFSHSLAVAALIGLAAALGARRLASGPRVAFAFVAISAASHGLLDMLTNGGRGVALWWPLSEARLFAPFRPVQVSPIGLHGLLDPAMLRVLVSEAVWIVVPAVGLGVLYRQFDRRCPSANIDSPPGQP